MPQPMARMGRRRSARSSRSIPLVGLTVILTLVAAGVAGPVAARGPVPTGGSPSGGLSEASSHSVSRSVGRGRTVDARTAQREARADPRIGRDLRPLRPSFGAKPGHQSAAGGASSSRASNLAEASGTNVQVLDRGPRIVPQATPVVTTAFPGIAQADVCAGNCEPPDPWIAVSSTHVVQSTNGMVRISNRSGSLLVSMPAWALFAVPADRLDSDPRILWDAFHARWVGVITTFTTDFSQNGLRFAVSETADPTGGWTTYPIEFGGDLPDYPGISTSGTRVVITSDDFTAGATFAGPTWLMIDWSNILAGTDLFIGGFSYTTSDFGHFRPAVTLSAVINTPILYENGSSPWYFELGGTAHAPTVPIEVDLAAAYGIEDFSEPPAPVQPGALAIASAADERPTDAVYRAGQLWFAATGDLIDGTDHWAKARYTRVLTTANGGGPTGAVDFFGSTIGTHFFMPGVGIAGDGSAFLAATKTNPTSIFPTTVLSAVLPGFAYLPYVDLETSTSAYAGVYGRWGDYLGIAADPSGTGAVWMGHELVAADGRWRTSVVRIVSDGTAPGSPGAVRQVQLTPATITSTVPVRTFWGAAADIESGVAGYLVERSDGGGRFAGVRTASTSITAPLRLGHTVRYRISAIDAVGNVGTPTYGPIYRPTLYQSTSSTAYVGSWGSSTSRVFSGGSARYATRAGATATFTATAARSVSIVATKAASRGSFRVYVDGISKGTVSTWSTTTRYRQLVYQFSWVTPGTHRIRIVVLGTRGHPRVDLDAFVVLR